MLQQIIAIVIITIFYTAYFVKMLLQKRKGIITDQIGKGTKPKKILLIERLMKIATVSIVPVEIISIALNTRVFNTPVAWIGLIMALSGVITFIIAMWTMRDNWRAGIPGKDKTKLVTTGIFKFSRNPAFLGFDLMYVGIVIAYLNAVHLFFTMFAIVMLHLQILQEEKFLTSLFGNEYLHYKKHTGRYIKIF